MTLEKATPDDEWDAFLVELRKARNELLKDGYYIVGPFLDTATEQA